MTDIKKARTGATVAGNNGQAMPDKNTVNYTTPANCDIYSLRAIFKPLEDDLTLLFQRKYNEFKRIEADLGRPGIFDWSEAKQKEVNRAYQQMKYELEVLCAIKDYLEYLTTFSIESWGKLSEQCFALQTSNAELRIRCRSHSKTEWTLIGIVEEYLKIIESLQNRLYS